MNPVTPTSAMSQGGTFVRPGAMAWGQGDSGVQDPATPAAEQAFRGGPGQEFPVDVTFPGEGGPDQVDAWISAHAEPFYIGPSCRGAGAV
jgi:hypothetical protein